jgi:hypothetical protein
MFPTHLIGDLDGAHIHIDYAVTPEQRLFLLVHLFGHTVQWNVSPGAFELGRPVQLPVKQESRPAIIEYEEEAAGYASARLSNADQPDGTDQFEDGLLADLMTDSETGTFCASS